MSRLARKALEYTECAREISPAREFDNQRTSHAQVTPKPLEYTECVRRSSPTRAFDKPFGAEDHKLPIVRPQLRPPPPEPHDIPLQLRLAGGQGGGQIGQDSVIAIVTVTLCDCDCDRMASCSCSTVTVTVTVTATYHARPSVRIHGQTGGIHGQTGGIHGQGGWNSPESWPSPGGPAACASPSCPSRSAQCALRAPPPPPYYLPAESYYRVTIKLL
eukprot:9478325-Pyramimonas_sp.AAC.1